MLEFIYGPYNMGHIIRLNLFFMLVIFLSRCAIFSLPEKQRYRNSDSNILNVTNTQAAFRPTFGFIGCWKFQFQKFFLLKNFEGRSMGREGWILSKSRHNYWFLTRSKSDRGNLKSFFTLFVTVYITLYLHRTWSMKNSAFRLASI